MKTRDDENETDAQAIPNLSVLTGGKGPPGFDWLSKFKEGSTLLVKPRAGGEQPSWHLRELTILFCADNSRWVELVNHGQEGIKIWIDPKDFCMVHTLHEIIEERL